MDIQQRYVEASLKTAHELGVIARSSLISELSRLTLPEIDAAVELVARLVPAGNVPGMILGGLANLAGRRPPLETVRRDIGLLFQGIEQMVDQAVYGAFFAGPAAVIGAYQQLLKLAGKDLTDSFPEGTWQFYVQYALREDTARHANETHGFDTVLHEHGITLSPVDRITAWAMAAIHCLHQYDQLLANEWRERVQTRLLAEVAQDRQSARVYATWERQRPYGRGADVAPTETYPAYRRRLFDQFMETELAARGPGVQQAWAQRVQVAASEELAAYQQQMSIMAYLKPGRYSEERVPIPLKEAQVGLIHRSNYFLLPVCAPGTDRPADVGNVRAQVAGIVAGPPHPPAGLQVLARLQRAAWPGLQGKLSPALRESLERLRLAPILLALDTRPRDLPLAELRRTERGVGNHPLTIVDTGTSFVLDQSHIFFDGAWGAALAEILTNEALAWAVYLHSLPPAQPGPMQPQPLHLRLRPEEEALAEQSQARAEVSAETTAVKLNPILALRKMFKKRSDLLALTVNDLLILYRAVHALTYRPAPGLVAELDALRSDPTTRQLADAALASLDRSLDDNPAILIPVDASQRSPRDRLYPLCFEAPLRDLDLLALHAQTLAALDAYQQSQGDRPVTYARFDELQRTYLATLAGFGAVMSRAKEIANQGETTSVGAIRLLAHMPPALQRLLDGIPSRFEVLNDVIRGREVFSNVGAVAPSSTLVRFITAKDDNEGKTLAWGVVTDAGGVVHLSLRDFRPHVGPLIAAGRQDLGQRIAQDYLDGYAHGLNAYVRELSRITLASRETASE
jgi:hypothetical protein